MPGIKEKLQAANKKRKAKKTIRNAKKNTTVSPYMKSITSKTQDPVRSGSAGSGSVKKTPKTFVEKAKSVMGFSKGGMLKKSSSSRMYSKGGFIQHD